MQQGDRVLITGATGFIGSRLAERLASEQSVHVRALVRTPARAAALRELGVEVVPGDITDPRSLRSACEGCQVVFHAAAHVSERGTKEEVFSVNVDGTGHLLRAAIAAGVRRVIHLSSCAVYGSLQRFDIDETTSTRISGNIYSDSKVLAEERLFDVARQHDLAVVAARASQVYGLGSPQFTLRPLETMRKGRLFLIDGGRHMCKPIYIDNLVDGLILCAQHPMAPGEAFNLTDGEPVPWRDFLGAYGTMLGRSSLPSIPYAVAIALASLFEVRATLLGKGASLNRRVVRSLSSDNSFSNRKARRMLGWEPKVDLQEGMRRTEAWLRREGYL
jgi:nucleoside-diphosphate-sugar epimerase